VHAHAFRQKLEKKQKALSKHFLKLLIKKKFFEDYAIKFFGSRLQFIDIFYFIRVVGLRAARVVKAAAEPLFNLGVFLPRRSLDAHFLISEAAEDK
jgi:hypothetical protein